MNNAEHYGFQAYGEHSPTVFDRHMNIDHLLEDDDSREHWAVMPVSQTRDSGPLEQSNFAQFLDGLGGESDTVEVHRFGHWGPGWYEIILVNPSDETAMKAAYDMAGALQDYPILDEDDLLVREMEGAQESWDFWARRDAERELESMIASRYEDKYEDGEWPAEPEEMASLLIATKVKREGLPEHHLQSDGVSFPYITGWCQEIFDAAYPF
jgi:hypothetical protein